MDTPEQLAEDPYGNAWLIKVQVTQPSELDDALAADTYRSLVEGA
jgi:glycine cleavage system H protein